MSLFYTGKTNGISVDMGNSNFSSVPVFEGFALNNLSSKCQFGGKEIENYLMNLMQKKGYNITTFAEKYLVRDIKEKLCFVSQDFEKKSKTENCKEVCYELPNGQVINVDENAIKCTEPIFNPSLIKDFVENKNFQTKSILIFSFFF